MLSAALTAVAAPNVAGNAMPSADPVAIQSDTDSGITRPWPARTEASTPAGPAGPLPWSQAMATGIAAVDEQHCRLLEIFNRTVTAQAEGASREAVNALLDALVNYTREHFRDEERLMRRWPVDPQHRAMHLHAHKTFRDFLAQAQALAHDYAGDVIVELLAFLAQWLLHHIMEVDQQMAADIHLLQSGGAAGQMRHAHDRQVKARLVDAVSQLSDRLGQRTFDLLAQRQRLLDLQALYRALLHCGDVLIQSRRERQMLQSLCAKLTQDTPFHAAWIGRPGASNGFDVLALAGEGAAQVRSAPPRLTDGETAPVVVKAWNSRRPVVCNDTFADASLQPWHAGFAVTRWLSVLALPILRARRKWAVLVLAAPRAGCFDAPTIEVCTRIGAMLGHGLDEFDLKKRIRTRQARDARMARTDTLTGLPNRLGLAEYLPQAIARAHRRGRAVAVGVLDLDDFKPVNDRWGHEAGDELLRLVSRGLREALRTSDFIARLGGDEFVVILEDLEEPLAVPQLSAALERLHRAVETPFEVGGGRRCSIEMTMGVVLSPADGTETDMLLRQADAAMYQAKQVKKARTQWWRLGVTPTSERIAETAFDPFGPDARELMRVIAPHLAIVAEQFSTLFYRELQACPETAVILASVSRQDFEALRGKQAEHLRLLLGAATAAQRVRETAQRLGAIHALVGVSGAWMARAMGWYRDLLRTHLDAAPLSARTRYRAVQAAEARLQLHIESQLQAMQSVLDRYQTLLARPIDSSVPAADWTQSELDALAALPGIRIAVLWRPDAQSRLVIEHAAGAESSPFIAAHRARDLYPVLDPRDVRGRGMVATTWMTDCQQVTHAYGLEDRAEPWLALMNEFGIRSAVTLPVHRHGAVHAVLMLFGAYPHQFACGWMRTWRLSLQNRWDQLTAVSRSRQHAIDAGQAARIRSLLYGGGVEMFVQPVIDLTNGALIKVEALARLRTAEGTLLAPGQFLPALGEADLDSLLRQGLEQGLGHLRTWRGEHLDIALSINLAPSSLVHPDCARWVREALRQAAVAPKHLTLELLESQVLEAGAVDEAIARLADTGVKLAIDDLGSGFSSLSRLADLPFDLIKVDQNIIRDLARDPLKALSLIRTVVQLGHDLERDVVVEGLEDDAAIEAATLLGCRFGQGYGLARPMPAAELAAWNRTRSFRGSEGATVHSWAGALAYQWMAMHDASHLRHSGDLASCPLTGFLAARGIDDAGMRDAHERIHDGTPEPARTQAMRQMMQWLAREARAR